jgi:hypothetical protein
MRKIAILPLVLIVIGITMLGCPGNGDNSSGDGNGGGNGYVPSPPADEPTAISQQTRVVLAEMFTGDW